MKCLRYHLQTLTIEISDQDIYQLCQVLIFRIQCISFLTDGGDGWFRGDGGHLGGGPSKRTTQTVLQMEDQRDGEKRHKGIKSESQSSGSGRSTQMQPQILQQLLTLVMRHEDTLRCLNLDSEFVVYFNSGQGGSCRAHEGQPRMEKQQGEGKNHFATVSLAR